MGSGCAGYHSYLSTYCALLLRPGGLATGSVELKLPAPFVPCPVLCFHDCMLQIRLLARFDEDPAVIYHTYDR